MQLRYRGESSQSLHELIADGFLGAGEAEDAHDLVHRIAIFSPTGRVLDVVSMTDVVRYLHKHKHALGDAFLNKTAADFGWAKRDVPSFSEKDIVASVLHEMGKGKLTAVAIVDDQQRFRHNFSTSDLRVGQGVVCARVCARACVCANFAPRSSFFLLSRPLPWHHAGSDAKACPHASAICRGVCAPDRTTASA